MYKAYYEKTSCHQGQEGARIALCLWLGRVLCTDLHIYRLCTGGKLWKRCMSSTTQCGRMNTPSCIGRACTLPTTSRLWKQVPLVHVDVNMHVCMLTTHTCTHAHMHTCTHIFNQTRICTHRWRRRRRRRRHGGYRYATRSLLCSTRTNTTTVKTVKPQTKRKGRAKQKSQEPPRRSRRLQKLPPLT
jgi:hypothetical protein